MSYKTIMTDLAGDIAFPKGSSFHNQQRALKRFNLAPPLYKWKRWRYYLAMLAWPAAVVEFLIRQIKEGVPLAVHDVPRHYNFRCREMNKSDEVGIKGLEEDILMMDGKRCLWKIKGK